MSINSISFWQQDQNTWIQAKTRDQSLANTDGLINLMSDAATNLASGLASIANQTALKRVNSQITDLLQKAVNSNSSSSAVDSSASSSSTSSGPSGSSLATGTGTVPLTTSTPLSTLGIPPNSGFTIGDGSNITTYSTTGSDTVADLIGAINNAGAGNAQVTASLNANGNLVLTGDTSNDMVTINGTFASAIGFGTTNDSFVPASASSPSTSSSSSSSGTNNSSAASTSGTAGSSSGIANNSAYALQTGGTAETLLASNGLVGNVINLLA